MNSKFKLKIICGFREDQEYTIDANEAHKAYYLFNNPETRTTFAGGLSLLGSDVRRIVPDYHATMGWNPTHRLDSDDMNELKQAGVIDKLRKIMSEASEIARICPLEDLQTPLLSLMRGNYQKLSEASNYAREVLNK